MSSTTPQKIKREDISGIECRHAVHCRTPYGYDKDLHLVKLVYHMKDGSSFPKTVQIPDYQRPFWITQVGKRNHKEKKEFEVKENVIEYKCTESQLVSRIAKALDIWGRDAKSLRGLANSPYLYGSDIPASSFIKNDYFKRFPDVSSPMTMAATDTETDMLYGTNAIIMQTISFKDRVFTAVVKSFLNGIANPEEELQKKLMHYLGDDVKKRNIKWEVMLVENDGEVVVEVMKRAHLWQPDFVAVWNILFDMEKMIESLQRHNIEPSDVFSDPSVPRPYRHFNFRIGPAQKMKSDGDMISLTPSQRWHSVTTPASFVMLDAMCVYRQIRTGSAEEPSYGLDYILDKEISRQKLKFSEADGFTEASWHEFMQENYPLEYVIYNVFDCVGMEILDEKTTDFAIKLGMFSGFTDYANFKSQPTRLSNAYFFHLLKEDKYLGTTSQAMRNDDDKRTVSGRNWITMLAAHLTVENGMQCSKEFKGLPTNVRMWVGDLDVEGSYPNAEMCFNIGKCTTKRELIEIKGISDEKRRRAGINLSGGYVNAVEISTTLFKLPTLDQMLASYLRMEEEKNRPKEMTMDIPTN